MQKHHLSKALMIFFVAAYILCCRSIAPKPEQLLLQGNNTCYDTLNHSILPVLSSSPIKYYLHDNPATFTAFSEYGVDFRVSTGTPIVAPVEGKIRLAFGRDALLKRLTKALGAKQEEFLNMKNGESKDAMEMEIKLLTDEISTIEKEGFISGINKRYLDYGYFVVLAWDQPAKVGNICINVESLYLHLSEIYVKVGDHVKSGQVLGLSGGSGFSTGSHLHYHIQKFLAGGSYWQQSLPISFLGRPLNEMWHIDDKGIPQAYDAVIKDFPANASNKIINEAQQRAEHTVVQTQKSTPLPKAILRENSSDDIRAVRCDNGISLPPLETLSQTLAAELKKRELGCLQETMDNLCLGTGLSEKACELGCLGWVLGNFIKKDAKQDTDPQFNTLTSTCL